MPPLRLPPECLTELSEKELEAAIQARGVALLRRYGWYILEMDRARKGTRRGAFRVGFVDVVALKGTRALLIEFKSTVGVVRPEQRVVHADLAAHAIPVHVIRDERDLLPLVGERSPA